MVTVESMLNATKEAPSIWLEYVNKKQCLKDNAYVFCFFEGEDRKYYNDRILNHMKLMTMFIKRQNIQLRIFIVRKVL